MTPSPVTLCPGEHALRAYISGQLGEGAAEALAAHLEICESCQQTADSLAPNSDSLIAALRQAARSESTSGEQLQQWMQAAAARETLPRVEAPTKQLKTASDTVNLAAFVDGVRRSGLLPTDDIDDWLAELQPADARAFAKALVKQLRLTRFQAHAILHGRHQHLVLGNYEVLKPLGEGGMGRVFKARHRQLRRIVCLKVLHAADRKSPQLVERFRREAKTVASLTHPNIVVAHDADDADGIPYLAMEFIDGQDLARHVETHGPFSPPDAVRIVLQAARALEYAHSQGVVHRDVKPSNLLLAKEARDSSGEIPLVKLLDLGLARFDSLLSENQDALTHTSMTSTGVVMGTVDYMSPEQALNSRKADQRSDIYSLGCTLFFLLTGRTLYPGETVMEKLVAHRERAIPSLIDAGLEIPASLDAIFERMVAKKPDGRYASMSEVAEDFERYLAGRPPKSMRRAGAPMIVDHPPIPSSRAARRRQAIGMAVGGMAILLVMVFGGWIVASTNWRDVFSPLAGIKSPDPLVVKPDGEPATSSPPISGHPDTFANGGKGRALLVIPHGWFYEDHFQNVTAALDAKGIAWQVASSTSDDAKPKHGYIPPVPVDVTLADASPDDFDAIFFLGGNVDEFTHKNPAGGQQARALIAAGLEKGRAVVGIDNGWDVVSDTGLGQDCQFTNDGEIQIGKPAGGQDGTFLLTRNSRAADQLVDAIVADKAQRY